MVTRKKKLFFYLLFQTFWAESFWESYVETEQVIRKQSDITIVERKKSGEDLSHFDICHGCIE